MRVLEQNTSDLTIKKFGKGFIPLNRKVPDLGGYRCVQTILWGYYDSFIRIV